jgi:phospholipase C
VPLASNPDAHGNPVRAFHMANTCQSHSLSQNWNSSHIQWNNGALDGFVRSPSGPAAMGYWDGTDLPFYYALANTFPVCDRWFASVLGQTYPNRRFLLCGSALGSVNTIVGETTCPSRRTARSSRRSIATASRGATTTRLLPSLFLFPSVFGKNEDKCPKIDQFFTDAAAGNLPSFCLVEPNGADAVEKKARRTSRWEKRSPRRW